MRGTGAYPFNKDPKAKDKPNINLVEPSNPITVVLRPAPVNMTVDNKGGAIKQGGSLQIDIKIARQNGCAGPMLLSLVSGPELKLWAAPVTVRASQSQAKMVIQAAKDSPLGMRFRWLCERSPRSKAKSIEVDEGVAVVINK